MASPALKMQGYMTFGLLQIGWKDLNEILENAQGKVGCLGGRYVVVEAQEFSYDKVAGRILTSLQKMRYRIDTTAADYEDAKKIMQRFRVLGNNIDSQLKCPASCLAFVGDCFWGCCTPNPSNWPQWEKEMGRLNGLLASSSSQQDQDYYQMSSDGEEELDLSSFLRGDKG